MVGADGKVRKTVDIPIPAMTMLHDMSLTQKYAVVYDLPCRLDLDMAFAGNQFPFSWQRGTGSRLGLLPREGAAEDIVWVDLPECYAFHPLNAYDQADGSVVIDICVYDTMFDVVRTGPFQDKLARLERWVVNPTRASPPSPSSMPHRKSSPAIAPASAQSRTVTDTAPPFNPAATSGQRSSTISPPASDGRSTMALVAAPASRSLSAAKAAPTRTTVG